MGIADNSALTQSSTMLYNIFAVRLRRSSSYTPSTRPFPVPGMNSSWLLEHDK